MFYKMSPVHVLQMSPVHVLQMSPVHVLQMSPVHVLQILHQRPSTRQYKDTGP